MSRTASAGDLRERMQRVANKPRPAAQGRASATPSTSAAGAASTRRPIAARAQQQRPSTATSSRLVTLAEWARWELHDVPLRRLAWLGELLRGE